MVPAFPLAVPRTLGVSEPFFFFFSLQVLPAPGGRRAGLGLPEAGVGGLVLTFSDRCSIHDSFRESFCVLLSALLLLSSLLCGVAGCSREHWPRECGVLGFLACAPRCVGPVLVMRSTSCPFVLRFSCLWGHFW